MRDLALHPMSNTLRLTMPAALRCLCHTITTMTTTITCIADADASSVGAEAPSRASRATGRAVAWRWLRWPRPVRGLSRILAPPLVPSVGALLRRLVEANLDTCVCTYACMLSLEAQTFTTATAATTASTIATTTFCSLPSIHNWIPQAATRATDRCHYYYYSCIPIARLFTTATTATRNGSVWEP